MSYSAFEFSGLAQTDSGRSHYRSMIRQLMAVAILLAMAAPVIAADGWSAGADLRGGFYASERDARDGSERSDESLRARLRAYVERDLSDNWLFRSRLAGTFSTAGNDYSFRLDPYRASGTGTRSGEVHFDEFFLRWQDAAERQQVRIGRFQTGFSLPVVPGKSLDRNDSSNVGIGWTDGVHWQGRIGGGWEGHAIAQFNHRRGTGNTARPPLSFTDSSSRVGSYLALRSTEKVGPLVMRMLSLNWIPDALATHGPGDPRRDDYLTATAKAAAEWPVGESGTRFLVAGEFGRSFNNPERSTLLLEGADEVAGNGYQVSANFFDIRPGHHLGVVYAHVQGGWLTSNDFRNNNELYEIRYQRRFTPNLSMEIRFRRRDDIESRIGAVRDQRDHDMYARLTWRIR